MIDFDQKPESMTSALWRMQLKLPDPLKFRFQCSLNHFDKAVELFHIDREMASFRAITGEEEAYSALIKAIQLREYPNANLFSIRKHDHKVAVSYCIAAISLTLTEILKEFKLIFDFEKGRADIKIPLSNFGIVSKGGAMPALQPIEPLDQTYTREGFEIGELYSDKFAKLAENANFKTIRSLVKAQANARNTLLYASDKSVPKSGAKIIDIENRRTKAHTALVLAIMVVQSEQRFPLVQNAIEAFLSIISRLPPSVEN